MKRITYFFPNPLIGFSIGKVFSTLVEKIKEEESIELYFVPSNRALPFALLKNIIFVFKNRNRKGINHITGDVHYCILALLGCKTVLTIHDLGVLDKVNNPVKRFIGSFIWLYLPAKLATEVVCISEKTKASLLQYMKVKNIRVIHNPLDPEFCYSEKPFKSKPVILHIGTAKHKNLERIIFALSSVKCHLRIVGKLDESIINILISNKIEYSNVFHLTNEQIIQEYIKCDIVSFPSLYEGFGMPIIEAQAIGRVVVTSLLAPMPEIGGDGAYYVDPYSVKSIKNGFIEVIENNSLRDELVNKGLLNVKKFSVQSIAKQYLDLYKNI
ncbi:MAG: glycosyltransferase family 1 protein [Bacteroidota bacterium]|nr:glycosyltransferase family 1 protein [Bacteroidota bacterium]